jgi:hypothetical protein
MDALVNAALVGTARQPHPSLATGTALDALLAALPKTSVERKVLLAAGLWATYRDAGRTAPAAPPAPEPAPPETRPLCSPGAAALLRRMLEREGSRLLPEALERLRRAGQILPPELLADALGTQSPEMRTALLPVLGERGHWLSRFNPAWRWVTEALPADGPLPDDAESRWQEGTPAARRAVLARLRSVDPTQAREWLAAAWLQERADLRIDLVAMLETGLSAADEPFLEAALDDRSPTVRAAAAGLLARIPGSALVKRMCARAAALLTWTGGQLLVAPPTTVDKDAQRDGIVAKAASGTGERAWCLTQIVGFVPPAHWTERFAVAPSDLIAAAQSGEWAAALLSGWTSAALLHRDAAWMMALWDWWLQVQHGATFGATRKQLAAAREAVPADDLLAALPGPEAERRARLMLDHPDLAESGLDETLKMLPQPWSVAFGAAYLQAARRYLATLAGSKKPDASNPWLNTLECAATALPLACLPQALEPWPLPEPDNWYLQRWLDEVETFTETLRQRQRLAEEIPV